MEPRLDMEVKVLVEEEEEETRLAIQATECWGGGGLVWFGSIWLVRMWNISLAMLSSLSLTSLHIFSCNLDTLCSDSSSFFFTKGSRARLALFSTVILAGFWTVSFWAGLVLGDILLLSL